ncbi:MAG: hypothetical protein ACRDZU_01615 [Acidimicrobiales bacterium]
MRKALVSGLLISAIIAGSVSGAGPAAADPAKGGEASAFAATATLAGNDLVPPTPVAEVAAPPFADAAETAIPIDADPLAINGTLVANAAVHENADLASQLEQPASAQAVAGPYNASAVGQIEDVEVLVDAVAAEVPLVEADAVRGEAVAKCVGSTVSYSASSEVVNLVIGGEDPLSGPLNDLITQITDALNASPLVDLVSIEVNDVTVNATGASVDALVVTVLQVVDPDAPLVQVRLGHAEVGGVTCGAKAACSDTLDNDGDGRIDALDPGCHTDGDAGNPDSFDPNDNDESDPQCSDLADNDGDGVIDAADPGCHSDGNASNPDSYDPLDPDETDAVVSDEPIMPVTGGSVPLAAAVGLGSAALALFALRRRTSIL